MVLLFLQTIVLLHQNSKARPMRCLFLLSLCLELPLITSGLSKEVYCIPIHHAFARFRQFYHGLIFSINP